MTSEEFSASWTVLMDCPRLCLPNLTSLQAPWSAGGGGGRGGINCFVLKSDAINRISRGAQDCREILKMLNGPVHWFILIPLQEADLSTGEKPHLTARPSESAVLSLPGTAGQCSLACAMQGKWHDHNGPVWP